MTLQQASPSTNSNQRKREGYSRIGDFIRGTFVDGTAWYRPGAFDLSAFCNEGYHRSFIDLSFFWTSLDGQYLAPSKFAFTSSHSTFPAQTASLTILSRVDNVDTPVFISINTIFLTSPSPRPSKTIKSMGLPINLTSLRVKCKSGQKGNEMLCHFSHCD